VPATTATNFYAPLGNLNKIGQKGIRINADLILKLSNQNYVFKKEAEKIIFNKLRTLKGKTLIKAKELLKKLYGEA